MAGSPTIPPQNPVAGGTQGYLEFESSLLRIQQDIEQLEREQADSGRDAAAEIKRQESKLRARTKRLYASLTPWETVLVARHPHRPLVTDYL